MHGCFLCNYLCIEEGSLSAHNGWLKYYSFFSKRALPLRPSLKKVSMAQAL
jgi:hypothetical protein